MLASLTYIILCFRDRPNSITVLVSKSLLCACHLHVHSNVLFHSLLLPETQPPPTTTAATAIAITMESAPVTTAPTTAATTMATTMESVPVTTEGDATGPSTNTTGIPTGSANTGATAAAVVVILIILIVSIVIATVVFVLLAKKHKSPKRVYSVRNSGVVQDGIGEFIIPC